jgi:asparagine synthase (glutamine-hydrolysing)
MCGIAGMFGKGAEGEALGRMVCAQRHRGPDAEGIWLSPLGGAGLGHNRLSIIDLSPAGRQPMWSACGRYAIVFNGEIYNYLELRAELPGYAYRSQSDTEVILAAYERWGEACLDRFVGMFAFVLWDQTAGTLLAVRDRFGVKPLYYAERPDGTLLIASEIKALFAAGVPAEPNPAAWAAYLVHGTTDGGERTFWRGVRQLPAGYLMRWRSGSLEIRSWYDIAERAGGDFDTRPVAEVEEEYVALLKESVRLRFRSDVPVGINLSGGLDSSTLLGLVHAIQGPDSGVVAYTFETGAPEYDETPWVRQMLARTRHPSRVCRLDANDVPRLAESVEQHEDEPFGGMPTLAYARLFEQARADGTIVLLDGQGMDEQWAGYDYYEKALNGGRAGVVQGISGDATRTGCLMPEFRSLAEPLPYREPFSDVLRNLQFRDIRFTKLPRALRYNDRVSMRASTELREPFLDHRLFELALCQPAERKIVSGKRKWMLRRIAASLLPEGVVEAPKRPLQTPQREWLRGPLRAWAEERIEQALAAYGGEWLDAGQARSQWRAYLAGNSDNSFYVWQWISIGMIRTMAPVSL